MAEMQRPDAAIRRVVTGYDATGRAVVVIDGTAPNQKVRPYGTISTLIWGSDETPAEIWSDEDFGAPESEIPPAPRGTWFRFVEFPPGVEGHMHRTDTVDYVLCMTGGADMVMDDGLTLHMEAGDTMVQQGTNHAWINRGDVPCRLGFILLDAKTPPQGLRGPGPQELAPLASISGGASPPLPPARRIVTTHDSAGKAIVMTDGLAPLRTISPRSTVSTLLWGTDQCPAEIWAAEDYGMRENEIPPPPMGSWFRFLDYPPGTPPLMQRTDTLDYVVCMAGRIGMELDDGATIHLNAGDVMVQNGTNHGWFNSGDQPARIAFAVIDAKPKG